MKAQHENLFFKPYQRIVKYNVPETVKKLENKLKENEVD